MHREGTRNLVDAAHAAGARQFIAQSISWVAALAMARPMSIVLWIWKPRLRGVSQWRGGDALERAVAEMERGIVLRYGTLYGLGTWYAPDGSIAQQVRQGQLTADEGSSPPIPGPLPLDELGWFVSLKITSSPSKQGNLNHPTLPGT